MDYPQTADTPPPVPLTDVENIKSVLSWAGRDHMGPVEWLNAAVCRLRESGYHAKIIDPPNTDELMDAAGQ